MGTSAVSDVVGMSIGIKGELSGSEDLTLHGRMEGSIYLPDHELTVGPQADVKADILARAVVIMGVVTGKVAAAERLEIGAHAAVTGDIESPRLIIADGASLHGKVDMPPAPAAARAARP